MRQDAALYTGIVTHHRHAPKVHNLRYRVYSVFLDLDRLDETARRCRFFSRNRFNVFAFHDRDHGDGSALPLRDQAIARVMLAHPGTASRIHRIGLLCMPRVLGYAFNPLSVYYCYDDADVVIAIIYEVNNTFGQRHTYVIPVDATHRHGADQLIRQTCDKRFHVSPFLPLGMRYIFRVTPPAARLSIAIDTRLQGREGQRPDGKPMLDAAYVAHRRTFSDATLLRTFFTHPLLTLKVVAGIHWEALFIWRKGATFHPLPGIPAPLSVVAADGTTRDMPDIHH
ncbi:DUF1365 family protein [Robbsia andropogonis]|uniref:DUF1365 domain-containing protein n=1 Tax=Robbsia andropogonis TaxID=28092 RepID=UPI00209E3A1B|nr:DUF1365 domain-containing protein [Robbsia andropogonis]MCP1118792.1 DUF1365 domain-containing protein [Robbsia andropogonis]MCP1128259.1 DUF1365 domain-containing protein [Robbsia andropogonis]